MKALGNVAKKSLLAFFHNFGHEAIREDEEERERERRERERERKRAFLIESPKRKRPLAPSKRTNVASFLSLQ